VALISRSSDADVIAKYHAYLDRFRKRMTAKSDWAVTAALNLLWEKSNDRSLLDIQEQKDKRDAQTKEAAH
jgi:hypothetical protein